MFEYEYEVEKHPLIDSTHKSISKSASSSITNLVVEPITHSTSSQYSVPLICDTQQPGPSHFKSPSPVTNCLTSSHETLSSIHISSTYSNQQDSLHDTYMSLGSEFECNYNIYVNKTFGELLTYQLPSKSKSYKRELHDLHRSHSTEQMLLAEFGKKQEEDRLFDEKNRRIHLYYELEPKDPFKDIHAKPITTTGGFTCGHVRFEIRKTSGWRKKFFPSNGFSYGFVVLHGSRMKLFTNTDDALKSDQILLDLWKLHFAHHSQPRNPTDGEIIDWFDCIKSMKIVTATNCKFISLKDAKIDIKKNSSAETQWKAKLLLNNGQMLKLKSIKCADTYNEWNDILQKAVSGQCIQANINSNMPSESQLAFIDEMEKELEINKKMPYYVCARRFRNINSKKRFVEHGEELKEQLELSASGPQIIPRPVEPPANSLTKSNAENNNEDANRPFHAHSYQILVKVGLGSIPTQLFNVFVSTKVSQLKHLIRSRLNFPVERVRLSYGHNYELKDNQTMESYEIMRNSTIVGTVDEILRGGQLNANQTLGPRQRKCLNRNCNQIVNYRAGGTGLCRSCGQLPRNGRLVLLQDGTYDTPANTNQDAANPLPEIGSMSGAQRAARFRQSETAEQTAARLNEQRLRTEANRQSETAEQTAARLNEQRLRTEANRQSETAEQTALRREQDRLAHELARQNETAEETTLRREQDRLAHQLTRQQTTAEEQEADQLNFQHQQIVNNAQQQAENQIDVNAIAQRMNETAKAQIKNIQRLLKSQLTRKVVRPDGINDDQNCFRQLTCRQYHVKKSGEDEASYFPMNDLFPLIHGEFAAGYPFLKPLPPTTDQMEVDQRPFFADPNIEQSAPSQMEVGLDSEQIDQIEVEEQAEDQNDAVEDTQAGNANFAANEAEEQENVAEMNLPDNGIAANLIEEADAEVIDYILDANEVDIAQVGPLVEPILRKATFIKQCDERCEILDLETGLKLYSLLHKCLTFTPQEMLEHITQPQVALEELLSIIKQPSLPKLLQENAEEIFFTRSILHRQDLVQQRFGKNIKEFKKLIGDLEVFQCDVCLRLRRRSDLQGWQDKWTKEYRVQISEPSSNVCKGTCATKLRKGERPLQAIQNRLDISEREPLLDSLNWIELALIQLVRPVQSMVRLHNAGGRATNIRAIRGALVMLPVPLEGTLDHLVQTLPSADNLKLLVSCENLSAVANLPKVLKALKWLVNNNALYKDITINHHFRFTDDDVIFDKPSTSQQLQALIELDESHAHLLEPQNTTVQLYINNTTDPPAEDPLHQYILKKNPFNPTKWDLENADARCYPQLFPTGYFGFHDVHRIPNLTHRQQIRHRLLFADRRFAQSPGYLALANGILAQKDIQSVMGIQARMKKAKLNVGELLTMVDNDDFHLKMCMSSMFANLRNYGPYWQKAKMEVQAKIALFGPPTWFLTLNPAERDWPELHEAYSRIYNRRVDASNIFEFVAKDPIIWCRQFQHRINAFVKTFFCPSGPFGKVKHFFYRIEYQQRGTEHVHCLLWTEDAPKPDSSIEEKLAYIDDHVTARLPDPKSEPELYALVTKHQMHYKTHSSTCRRKVCYRRKTRELCRFEFPRPSCPKARFNDLASDLRGYPGTVKRSYSLARRPGEEQWVNDYNPSIILAWNGNVDLQYIMGDSLDAVNYITGYTTKQESGQKEDLFRELQGSAINNSDMFRICIDLLRKREIGMMELADTLLGHPMRKTNVGHVFINTNVDNGRQRMLKPKAAIEQEDQNDQAYIDNWNDQFYPQRHEELAQFSLFNIRIYFKKVGEQNVDGDEIGEIAGNENDTNHGIFSSRYHVLDELSPFYCHPDVAKNSKLQVQNVAKPAYLQKIRGLIPRLYWPKFEAENEANREDFYRRLCVLFIPWRNEAELKDQFNFYEERWNVFMEELEAQSPDALADINAIIESHVEILRQRDEIYKRRRQLRANLNELDIEDNPENELAVFDRAIDETTHLQNVERLNEGQRRVFNKIVNSISNGHVVCQIVLGTAGVGKSALIDALADEVALKHTQQQNRSIQPAVMIAAPTGLAAINIRGNTLHSLFAIQVQRGKNAKLNDLRNERLQQLRLLFTNCRLLIIDEISMCSNVLLTMVHLRCQQIMASDEPFGGLSVLLLGDLLQLPPVKSPHVFKTLRPYDLNKYFNAPSMPLNLWTHFEFDELTQNMRQRDDLEYGELMNRMRIQALTDEDINLLQSRVIEIRDQTRVMEEVAVYYTTLAEDDPHVLAIFATNEEVSKFNEAVANEMELETFVIDAQDSWERKSEEGVFHRLYQRIGLRVTDKLFVSNKAKDDGAFGPEKAAGLERSLHLAINGRIMLRRNLDKSRGLINGSTGVLVEIGMLDNHTPN